MTWRLIKLVINDFDLLDCNQLKSWNLMGNNWEKTSACFCKESGWYRPGNILAHFKCPNLIMSISGGEPLSLLLVQVLICRKQCWHTFVLRTITTAVLSSDYGSFVPLGKRDGEGTRFIKIFCYLIPTDAPKILFVKDVVALKWFITGSKIHIIFLNSTSTSYFLLWNIWWLFTHWTISVFPACCSITCSHLTSTYNSSRSFLPS